MKKFRFIILLYIIISLSACLREKNSVKDIDNFILKYKNEHFTEIRNISIAQRSRGNSEITYIVSKYEENYPVYFVTFDLKKKEVTNIDKSNLEKTNTPDYLTQPEIFNAVNTIRKYNFYLLGVDSSENVYINPFYADAPAFFLRLKTITGDSIVKKGYAFELYKDNWYLNRTR